MKGSVDKEHDVANYGLGMLLGSLKALESERREIEFSQIERDESIWPRSRWNEDAIDKHVRDYQNGEDLPDPVVFEDETGRLRLADGFHRFRAMSDRDVTKAFFRVFHGSVEQAWVYAMKANGKNGMKLSAKDRQIRLGELLSVEQYANSSNQILADLLGVSEGTIRNDLKKLGLERPVDRLGADGRIISVSQSSKSDDEAMQLLGEEVDGLLMDEPAPPLDHHWIEESARIFVEEISALDPVAVSEAHVKTVRALVKAGQSFIRNYERSIKATSNVAGEKKNDE